LARSNLAVIDSSDSWSEEDQGELTSFSLEYASRLYPENEELV
jgi:hypothetical protein